jgi:hypothetical protein
MKLSYLAIYIYHICELVGQSRKTVMRRKRAAVDGIAGIYLRRAVEKVDEALTGERYKQIGRMKMQIDFLLRELAL